eukprot:COSAG01_NODE_12027_length_1813_cov_2.124271_2_plen_111_part_00
MAAVGVTARETAGAFVLASGVAPVDQRRLIKFVQSTEAVNHALGEATAQQMRQQAKAMREGREQRQELVRRRVVGAVACFVVAVVAVVIVVTRPCFGVDCGARIPPLCGM